MGSFLYSHPIREFFADPKPAALPAGFTSHHGSCESRHDARQAEVYSSEYTSSSASPSSPP